MKILISINTTWNIYNFRLDLIHALLELGHEVIALAPADEYVTYLEDIGIRCYHVKLDAKGTNPIRDLSLIRHYYRVIRVLKPDLILSYTIKPNIYGNFAGSLLKIPVINNISGLGTLFITTNFATYIGKALYKKSLATSAHVFFQNKDDRQLFIENKLVDEGITSIVPGSGVDVEKFDCDRSKNKGNKFLFVGRLISDKGVIEYLKAAISILHTHPDKVFLLVGELGSNNKTAITSQEIGHYTNNYPQIKYLGKIDDMREILKSVDVLVLPSYREGLSKSLIEAASMRLPIITSNTPGCKDVVEDMFNGLLCEAKSTDSLVASIYKMINLTEKERLNLGCNGRKKAMELFSSKIVNRIYIRKIDEICN